MSNGFGWTVKREFSLQGLIQILVLVIGIVSWSLRLEGRVNYVEGELAEHRADKEIHQTIGVQGESFMTRRESDVQFSALRQEIAALRDQIKDDRAETRAALDRILKKLDRM